MVDSMYCLMDWCHCLLLSHFGKVLFHIMDFVILELQRRVIMCMPFIDFVLPFTSYYRSFRCFTDNLFMLEDMHIPLHFLHLSFMNYRYR